MFGYIGIIAVTSILGMVISRKLKLSFSKYAQIPIQTGLSGKEIAEAMLKQHGITDVKVVPRKGNLTDHYNPLTKTIALSEPVYGHRSISAAAVAAHECGHAVQHATNYKAMWLRSALVPIIQLSSKVQQGLFFAMILGIGGDLFSSELGLGILTATFGATALFALVTLPVEFNASSRAIQWLDDTDVIQDGAETAGAEDGLRWAAMTYVAQAFSAMVIFLYFGYNLLTKRGQKKLT